MKPGEIDQEFDEGKDVAVHLDLFKTRRRGEEQRRVNVDFSSWMVEPLDREAERPGCHSTVDHQGLNRGTVGEEDLVLKLGRPSR